MLASLKELFDAVVGGTDSARAAPRAKPTEHTLQLAAAVLLVEVMRSDEHRSDAVRRTVVQALRREFSLSDDEVARLVELAEATSRDAPDLYSFTSQLHKGFDLEQKLRIVELLWQVAYADGSLAEHENHLMRKLGALLHISRGDFVAAKQRGRAAAGVTESDDEE